MKYSVKQLMALLVVLFLLNYESSIAQSGGEFEIIKSTINNGGGTVSGGEFEINASIGQTITQTSSVGEYQIESGFWNASSNIFSDIIFINGFETVLFLVKNFSSEVGQ